MSAVQLDLLYGSEIYHTVSEQAIMVIAGVISNILLADERRSIYFKNREGNKEAATYKERAAVSAPDSNPEKKNRRLDD